MPAAQHKNALLAALAERLLALAGQAPVLLLLEDAHWIDPTTQELLDRIVDRVEADARRSSSPRTGRNLCRPGPAGPYVTSLAFNRLERHGLYRHRRRMSLRAPRSRASSWPRSCAAATACRSMSRS